MKNRDLVLFFQDILECIDKIEKYTFNMNHEDFVKDEKTFDAVVKNMIIIGEAAKFIPDEIRNSHPEVEFKLIIGMRNILVHNYLGTDYKEVWRTAKEEMPILKVKIQNILNKLKRRNNNEI
jgi:uncharacterized protein with HEPN domain